jgi:hypothetical protein
MIVEDVVVREGVAVDHQRWDRFVSLSGVGFVVLYLAGFGLIGEVGGTSTPSAAEIGDLFSADPTRTLVGAYLSLLSLVFLLLFVGSLRSTLRIAEGANGRLSATASGGGVAVAAVLAVGFAVIVGAAMRADSVEGLSPDVGLVFYDIYQATLVATAVGFAVLIGSTAVVAFRTKGFPGWLAWASAIVAIGLITPIGFFFVFLALMWVFIASIWLFVSARTQSDQHS